MKKDKLLEICNAYEALGIARALAVIDKSERAREDLEQALKRCQEVLIA